MDHSPPSKPLQTELDEVLSAITDTDTRKLMFLVFRAACFATMSSVLYNDSITTIKEIDSLTSHEPT